MNSAVILLIAAMGVAIGVLSTAVVLMWRRGPRSSEVSAPEELPRVADDSGADARGLGQLLAVLPGASLLVDGASGAVERATARAVSLGLVVSDRLATVELRSLVSEVYRDGITREHDMAIRRPALAKGALELRARAARLDDGTVLVLVEDLSGARRVDTVRRDFVANVSHELKTPVGALSLLSEAISEAADDPEAVQRFAERMRAESGRLTRLVGDLIDLSRLQGDRPLENATAVDVEAVVAEAVDAVRTAARSQEIEIVVGPVPQVQVFGVEDQLVTALRNLLANAIAYSQPRTRVAVGVAERDNIVNVSVTDQGIGIAEADLERIFERFYRVDQARSRVTGGTGLGLAIVKHICNNHGGDVTVWSVAGEGSTFTLRLPRFTAGSGAAELPQELPALSGDPFFAPPMGPSVPLSSQPEGGKR